MKKILFFSFLFCLAFAGKSFALQIQSLYSGVVSNASMTSTSTIHCDINKPSVRIKQIMLTNAGTAQTVSVYKNAYSTSAASVVATIVCPASTPVYFPSQPVNDDMNFDIPYFAIKTSTSTNKAYAVVLYKD